MLTTLALAPHAAWAGACFSCESADTCVAVTGNTMAQCVQWNVDFGCGELRLGCCPGQGCNVDGAGTPSCELTGACMRIGGVQPAADASVGDVGVGDRGVVDASVPASADAASGMDVRTATAPDASSLGRLGGGNAERSSSCNCEAASNDDGGALVLLGALALVFSARRLRRS